MPDPRWLEIVHVPGHGYYLLVMHAASTGVVPDTSEGPYTTAGAALDAARTGWPGLVTRKMEEAMSDGEDSSARRN